MIFGLPQILQALQFQLNPQQLDQGLFQLHPRLLSVHIGGFNELFFN
jgi:hypothetical protein